MKCFVMGMLAVLVAVNSSSAATTILYQEDFEGVGSAKSLQDVSPWLKVQDLTDVEVNDTVQDASRNITAGGIEGFGIDGTSNGHTARDFTLYKTGAIAGLDMTDPLATSYELTFNAYARGASGGGTGNAGFGFGDSKGNLMEFAIGYGKGGNGGWRFDTHQIGGGRDKIGNSWIMNDTEVKATITIDLIAGEARARVESVSDASIFHDFNALSLDKNHAKFANFQATDRIALLADVNANGSTTALDVDNIMITKTVVPEPATMGLALLALCGLAVIRRKR